MRDQLAHNRNYQCEGGYSQRQKSDLRSVRGTCCWGWQTLNSYGWYHFVTSNLISFTCWDWSAARGEGRSRLVRARRKVAGNNNVIHWKYIKIFRYTVYRVALPMLRSKKGTQLHSHLWINLMQEKAFCMYVCLQLYTFRMKRKGWLFETWYRLMLMSSVVYISFPSSLVSSSELLILVFVFMKHCR